MLLVSLGRMDRLLPSEISTPDEGRSPPVGAACSPPVFSRLSSVVDSLYSKSPACEESCSFKSSMVSWSFISDQQPSSSNVSLTHSMTVMFRRRSSNNSPELCALSKYCPLQYARDKKYGVYVLNITAVPKRKRREDGERWVWRRVRWRGAQAAPHHARPRAIIPRTSLNHKYTVHQLTTMQQFSL